MRLRRYEIVCAGLAITLSTVASCAAIRSHGTPVPSCFLDPYGELSAVYPPGWGAERWGAAAAARVRTLDGEPVRASRPSARAEVILDRVRAAHERGATSVLIELEGIGARRASIRTLDGVTIALFFSAYAIMGGCLLWSGLLVLRIAGRRPGARAYAATCVVGFVFFVCFYDYQTTRWLVPLFAAATFGIPTTVLALAFSFPDPPTVPGYVLRLLQTGLALACGLCLVLAIAPFLPWDARPLRLFTNAAVPLSLVVLALVMLVRRARSVGRARDELRAASAGLVVAPVVAAVGLVFTMLAGSVIFHILLPVIGFIVPAAIAHAYVRHNILASERVLTSRMTFVPVLTLGIATAELTFVVAYEVISRGERGPLFIAGALALFAGGTVMWVTRKELIAFMFPARRIFRPVVADLASMLAHVRSRDDAAAVLERIVARWLPAEDVEVVIDTTLSQGLASRASVLSLDGAWWIDDPSGERRLVVPMQTAERPAGAITVSPKHGGAPFGMDDVMLLETIATIGALAVRHVDAQVELSALRNLDLASNAGDGVRSLDLVSTELAHEIAYPLMFFRYLVDTLAREEAVPGEDVAIGRDEISRLERMLAAVRSREAAPPLAAVELRVVVDRAKTLLRGAFARTFLEVFVPAELTVRADEDILLQLLANLLRNAAEAAGEEGVVHLIARGDAEVVIEVRDDGPGLTDDAKRKLSTRYATEKPHGTGIGLAVARRIVATLGWRLETSREDGWTVFRVHATRGSKWLEGAFA